MQITNSYLLDPVGFVKDVQEDECLQDCPKYHTEPNSLQPKFRASCKYYSYNFYSASCLFMLDTCILFQFSDE